MTTEEEINKLLERKKEYLNDVLSSREDTPAPFLILRECSLKEEIHILEEALAKAKAFDILNEKFEFTVNGDVIHAYGKYEETWNDIDDDEAKTINEVL